MLAILMWEFVIEKQEFNYISNGVWYMEEIWWKLWAHTIFRWVCRHFSNIINWECQRRLIEFRWSKNMIHQHFQNNNPTNLMYFFFLNFATLACLNKHDDFKYKIYFWSATEWYSKNPFEGKWPYFW